MATEAYSVLYRIQCRLFNTSFDKSVAASDIVSVSIIHNYDIAMYPIIRIRLYSDLSTMQGLVDDPDHIYVNMTFSGNVCNLNYQNEDSSGTVQIIDGANNYDFRLKAYIENKNTLTSMMDQYDHGLKKDSDLNTNNKVPITIFAYDADMINSLKQKSTSIYKNMSITTIIEDMTKNAAYKLSMDNTQNQSKFTQILLPNISIKDSITFFEKKYGLYKKGGNMYGEKSTLYIVDTDVNNGTTPIPIYVESYKNSSDMSGLKKYSTSNPKYIFNTKAQNVSVLTESDIEKVLNSSTIADVNVNTWDTHEETLAKIYTESDEEAIRRINAIKNISKVAKISTPDTLHKSYSPFISSTNAARLTERVTRVDLSGTGFDVFRIDPRSRFNLIFESPIRGMSINQLYRLSSTVHTFSNLSSDFFVAQTTMSLCSN